MSINTLRVTHNVSCVFQCKQEKKLCCAENWQNCPYLVWWNYKKNLQYKKPNRSSESNIFYWFSFWRYEGCLRGENWDTKYWQIERFQAADVHNKILSISDEKNREEGKLFRFIFFQVIIGWIATIDTLITYLYLSISSEDFV
jgi:hypothetical protein